METTQENGLNISKRDCLSTCSRIGVGCKHSRFQHKNSNIVPSEVDQRHAMTPRHGAPSSLAAWPVSESKGKPLVQRPSCCHTHASHTCLTGQHTRASFQGAQGAFRSSLLCCTEMAATNEHPPPPPRLFGQPDPRIQFAGLQLVPMLTISENGQLEPFPSL